MRLEHSQQEHQRDRNSTNGSSQNGSSPHANGSARSNGETNGFHGNGFAAAVAADTSPFYGHDREEVTRILLQSLSDLGYRGAAEQLSRESGYQLEIPSVAAFRSAVQLGEWEEAETLLFGTENSDQDGGVSLGNGSTADSISSARKERHSFGSQNGSTQAGLPLSEGADTTWLRFLIRQQKYLELLEQRDLGAALGVLRNELAPLKKDVERLHSLSALMMSPSPEKLREDASWDGSQGDSRSELLSEISKSISPSVMIPEHRLATLFTSVQQQQILNCQYHNTVATPSLYTDHECASEDFPLQALTELRNQTDEVWYLDFSHDGTLLATAGRDGLVNVYDTKRWMIVHEFREHERNITEARGVTCVAFSPNDRYLISCSQNNEFVVMDVRDGHMVCKADHFDYPVTTAAWLPDSLSFVVGTQSSKRPLGLYTMRSSNGSGPSPTALILNYEIHSWREPLWENGSRENSFRVSDVAVSQDGTRMAAATTDNRIMTYDLRSRNKVDEWPMEDKITSINYSADGTLLLVNMNDSEINMGKLWTLDSTTGEEVMRYEGAQQAEFVIRSCFGGAGENFVISGSEDSHVFIWRRQTGAQVAALEAHAPGTVNAVAWHPTDPSIFASAGDDRRVRIWTSSKGFTR